MPGRPLLPRSAIAVAVLGATLVLVAALAFQAVDAARLHRAGTEEVLRDYATFAAEQFAQTYQQVAGYRVANPMLYALSLAGAADPETQLVSPRELHDNPPTGTPEVAAEVAGHVRFIFRIHLDSAGVAIGGGTLDPGELRWLRDTLIQHAAGELDDEWQFGTIAATLPGIGALFYRLGYGTRDNVAFGFGLTPGEFVRSFELAKSYGGMLPASLTNGTPEDSLLAVHVIGAAGDTVYTTGGGSTAIAGSYELEPHLGGLRVTAALLPDAAERLIIGGIPASRIPLLLTLLTITISLVITALVLLYREYELARMRSEFVSGVSHELRTPLAQIRMFAETMLLGRVRTDGEAQRSLEIIDQEARRLTHLVENLLHFSRSEKGMNRIAPEPVDLGPLVCETTEGFSPLARLKHVTLATDVQPVVANVDRSAIQQMLLNLLDNATKYGPEGQTVTVGLRKTTDAALIWVDDEGPGIPPQLHDRIWERFWRSKDEHESTTTGTGIGLSVVRELAILHGGSTWVERGAGERGARFVISVPAVTAGGTALAV